MLILSNFVVPAVQVSLSFKTNITLLFTSSLIWRSCVLSTVLNSTFYYYKYQVCTIMINLYSFTCTLSVTGSRAYKTFHPMLFQKSLDILNLQPETGIHTYVVLIYIIPNVLVYIII